MNTKGMKFLAVLAVLAMAFAAVVVISDDNQNADAATSVEIGDFTFDFATDFTYTTYGNIDVSAVQNLTVTAEGNYITLKGDLATLTGEDATSATVKALWGVDTLTFHHGIAFTIAGLTKDTSIVKLNTTTGTALAATEPCFLHLDDALSSTAPTTFTVVLNKTGAAGADEVFTVDYSDLIKAETGSKKYFTVQDAVDAASISGTVTILKDVAQDLKINKAVTVKGASKDVKFVGKLLVNTTAWTAGKISIQDMTIKAADKLVCYSERTAAEQDIGTKSRTLEFKNCDLLKNYEADNTFVWIDRQCGTFIFDECSFGYADGVDPATVSDNAMWVVGGEGSEVAGRGGVTGGKLVVTNCVFTGFARTINTNFIDELTVTGNTFVSENEAGGSVKTIQVASVVDDTGEATPSATGLTGMKILVENNTLPAGKTSTFFMFHGTGDGEKYSVDTVKIEGSVKVDKKSAITIPAGKTLEVGNLNLTTVTTSVIDNAGTLTINDGLTVTGKLTNTSVINFNGTYDRDEDGVFTNTNGTINCAEASQAQLFKADGIAGTIKYDGSDVPAPTPVPEGGKVTGDADIINVHGAVTEASAKENQTIMIDALSDEAVLDVSKSNSEIVASVAMGENDTATVKTATSTITVKGLQGTLTFSSGSIIVKVAPWADGTIYLNDGDVLKISGNVTGAATIEMAAGSASTAKATVIIEDGEGKDLTIADGITLEIKSKIAVQVDGKINASTGTLKTAGVLTVNGTVGSKINATNTVNVNGKTTGDVKTTKTFNVYGTSSGEFELSGDDAKLIAYQASDINGVTLKSPGADPEYDAAAKAQMAKVSGKDANGGTWAFDGNNKLTVTGYSGAYNFGVTDVHFNKAFAEMITTIVLSGESKITLAVPETDEGGEMFPAVTEIKTIQGTGSIAIELDVSKASETAMEDTIYAIGKDGAAALTLSSVTVNVTIKGTNNTWDLKKICAYGIKATNLTMDSSELNVDVLSALTAKETKVFGIKATNVTLNNSDISVASAGIGFAQAGKIQLKNNSGVLAYGKAFGMSIDATGQKLEISGESGLMVTNGLNIVGPVEITQASALAAEKLTYGADPGVEMVMDNYGTVAISGAGVIGDLAVINNYDKLTITGNINVFGKIENKTGGEIYNTGAITVFAKKLAETADKDIDFTPSAAAEITSKTAQVDTITLNEVDWQTDGTLKVKKATVTFAYKTGEDIVPKDSDAYTGTLKAVQTVGADKKDYTLTLTNGTSTITVIYDSSKDAELGKGFVMEVTGTIVDVTDASKKYSVSKPGQNVVADTIDDLIGSYGATAVLLVTAGKFTNEGTVSLYGTTAQTIVGADAEYIGNLTTGAQAVTIDGKFTGDLAAKGNVTIGKGTFDGNLTTSGNVVVSKTFKGGDITATGSVTGATATATITVANLLTAGSIDFAGTITGDIFSKGNVTVMNVAGDITVDKKAGADVTFTGKVEGKLTYNSKAKAKVPGEGETVDDTTYPVVMTVDVDMRDANGAAAGPLVIKLVKATDATETEAAKPGYFSIEAAGVADLAEGKNVNLTMTEGKMLFSESVVMPKRYALVFETATTMEVSTVATVDFSDAALKVSKDATSNFVTGSTPVTEYGLVKAIMSFTIQDGAYTIYSDVAYALINCEEGSKLTVESNATINDNVSIKKDVTVTVDDGVTVDFGKYGLVMDEGAKIVLTGTGKLTFAETWIDKTEDDWVVYTINGTIEYEDNILALGAVMFNEGPSTIAGLKATSTEAAKFNVALTYNFGVVDLKAGYMAGTVVLTNVPKVLAKDADATLVFGILSIEEGATCEAVITDAAMVAELNDEGDGYDVTRKPTMVDVDGILKIGTDFTVNGVVVGDGQVVLGSGKTLTVAKGVLLNAAKDIYYGPVVSVTIVDTTEPTNGFLFTGVMSNPADAGVAVSIKAESGLKFAGQLKFGSIDAINETTVAKFNVFTVMKDAAICADKVEIIAAGSIADGAVMTLDLVESTGKTLTYDTTYMDGLYTVYTAFANIDFDEVDDVTIAVSKTLAQLLGEDKALDLSGRDVNITIAEGKTLTLTNVLIIGTPATTLGTYSSITGKVIIANSTVDVPKYLVAYADVDLSEAEIYQNDEETAAVYSTLTIEDLLYATIFANPRAIGAMEPGVKLAFADKTLVPDIEGYVFTKWSNLNDDPEAAVGETSAYANAKAVLVNVTVKFAEGVSYYLDGVEFAIYDTPTKVEYNSVFTAKINNTAKYEGTPLINGKNSFIVTEDATLTVTGVNPIPVPPEPEPEPVIGDSGISLTDILLIVLVVLIAIMVVILVLRLNRS